MSKEKAGDGAWSGIDESGNPGLFGALQAEDWTPAFAGVTVVRIPPFALSLSKGGTGQR